MNKLMFLAFDCVKDCGGADILRILKFVFKLLDLVLFIVPMGLIIMVILDFSKNVIAGKEDEMKKNVSVAIKRIIYCMVIFLVPTIVNFAVNFVSGTGDNIAAKASYCIDYAKNKDLSKCEIFGDNLGGVGESGVGESIEDGVDGIIDGIMDNFNDVKDKVDSGIKDEIDESKEN